MYLDPANAFTSASESAAPPAGYDNRRAERVAFDLMVRFAWKGLRATVMLKDLTPFGARIQGVDGLRKGDGITLLLPGLPATEATVAWSEGGSAGLLLDLPLDHAEFVAMIRDFGRERPDFGSGPHGGMRWAA